MRDAVLEVREADVAEERNSRSVVFVVMRSGTGGLGKERLS